MTSFHGTESATWLIYVGLCLGGLIALGWLDDLMGVELRGRLVPRALHLGGLVALGALLHWFLTMTLP